MKKFSVVIPTYDRPDSLVNILNCLSLNIQSFPCGSYEVIVSDDSLTASARNIVENSFPWVTWVPGPKKGPAANRNNGANYAFGEWLIFTDDDCLPKDNWLKAYKEAIQIYPEVQVFEGKTIEDKPKQRFDEEAPINTVGGFLWSCNFCIRKSLFWELGGFDECFPYAAMEDVDLRVRLEKRFIKYLFVEDAVCVHPWRIRKVNSALFRHFNHVIESHLYFLTKHPEQKAKVNSVYFIKSFMKGFWNNTLKNFFRYSNIKYALAYHFFELKMSIVLFFSRLGNDT